MIYNSEQQIFCQESFEMQYASALKLTLLNGVETSDRTGTGRRRMPNVNFSIDCRENRLPILQGKQVFPKMAIKEITWMMMGLTNIAFLEMHGVTYWREWADVNGDLGAVYGKQFRDFNGVDQLANAIDILKNNRYSTQNIINLWNAADLSKMKLPPCHFSYTFQVIPDENGVDRLNIHLVQRSADAFLGVPYNAIMVSYMLNLFSRLTGIEPGWVFWTLQDFHIYLNHFEQVSQYLDNVEENKFDTIGYGNKMVLNGLIVDNATCKFNPMATLSDFFMTCHTEDFKNIAIEIVEHYQPIKAEIAV